MPKSFLLDDRLHDYLMAHTTPPDPIAQALIDRTAQLGDISRMQISPEQGAFMGLLTAAMGATRAVEVGVFTGYSALCVARALGPHGTLLACDVSEEWTAIGRQAWDDAGVADRIDLRLAPAADTLAALPHDPMIDIAFIDADKTGYITYWDEIVPRLRPGGVILVDNVLWSGAVLDDDITDDDTVALRAFNAHAAADERTETVMLPIADGLLMARRR